MKKSFFKRAAGCASAVALSLSMLGALPANAADYSQTQQFLKKMGAGWNLGNTLEATGGGNSLSSETSWGNPTTTKALIQTVHDAGFNTIRIPVSWGNHTTGSDYKIDSAWMARVKEVVDYAYDDGMYVILNVHHDNGTASDWGATYYPNSAHKEASIAFLNSVWSQIADEFSGYDEKLVFETLNEPRLVGTGSDEWWFWRPGPNEDVSDAISTINYYNQEIVKTIRKSGGNNADRYIMCPGYGASADGALTNGYVLPTDTVSHSNNRILVSVHAYTPYDLCLGSETDISTDKYVQFTQDGKNELSSLFSELDSKFIANGTGVVIGEMGISYKSNNEARTAWSSYYYGLSKQYSIPCVLWDNNVKDGANKSENHWHLNRSSLQWEDPDVIQAMRDAMGVSGEEEAEPEYKAEVAAASLTLDGLIGLNFYTSLPEEVTGDSGAYAKLVCDGGTYDEVIVPVSQAKQKSGYYIFSFPLPPKDIECGIEMQLFTGSGEVVPLYSASRGTRYSRDTVNYSGMQYLSLFKDNETAREWELVNFMITLCRSAKNLIDGTNYDLGWDTSWVEKEWFADQAYEIGGSVDGIALSAASLSLEAGTDINIKFKLSNPSAGIGKYTFTIDGKKVTPKNAGGGVYVLTYSNIPSVSLDSKHTFKVSDGANEQYITYSAISYVYQVMSLYDSKDDLTETEAKTLQAARALYVYSNKSKEYKGIL